MSDHIINSVVFRSSVPNNDTFNGTISLGLFPSLISTFLICFNFLIIF